MEKKLFIQNSTLFKKILFIFFLSILYSIDSYAQCPGIANNACTTAAPAVVSTSITCTPPNNEGGRRNFLVTNMIAGSTYTISNCGSTTVDTQMTMRDAGGTSVAFNDDFCGLQSTITFIPATTGDYRIHLNAYNCLTTPNALLGTITVTLTAAPITNDICSGAISITPSVDATCNTTTGSTIGATDNNETGDCTVGTEMAVWYSFTATSTDHDVFVDGIVGFDSVVGAISTCGTTTIPTGGACTDNTGNGAVEELNLTGLTIGSTYYIQVYEYFGDQTANGFTICVTTPTVLVNDVCSGAISITPSVDATCNTTTGSTIGATDNNETGDCTVGTEMAVWYSFTATSTDHDVFVDGIVGFDSVVGAISTCGTTTIPTGGACTDNTGNGAVEELNLTGLTIGSTYYIQVYEYFGDQTANGFTICVTTPTVLVNDVCSGAISITPSVDATCNTTTGSTIGATDNNETGDCTVGTEMAVWYSFTATSTDHDVFVDGIVGFDSVVGAISTCGTTTVPTGGACTDNTGNGAVEELNLTGLTIGSTYYIQVYEYFGDQTANGFTICVTTPTVLVNDVCSGAISITPSVDATCNTTTGSTVGATDNNETGDCTVGTEMAVWYSFTATSTDHDVFVDGIVGFDSVVGAISTCGTTTIPTGGACTDNTGNGAVEELNLTGLTIGSTYYIQVYEYFGDQTANGFTICVTTPTPCATPTAQPTLLTFGTVTETSIDGSFTAATPAPDNYLVVYNTTGTTPAPVDGTSYIVGDTIGAGNIVADNDVNTTFSVTGLANNTTYYFFIFSFNNSGCVGGPAYNTTSPLTGNEDTLPGLINDVCSGAVSLTPTTSCTYTTYTNEAATDSGVADPGCANYGGGDIWFSVLVPASGELTIDTQTNVITDGGMAVYSGTCAGTLTLIECDDDTNGLMPTITRSDFVPGTTIYVRVWEYGNNNNGAFGICVTTPLPCTTPTAQPTVLTFGTITQGSIDATFVASVPASDNYLVVYNTTGTTPTPVDTTTYIIGDTIGAGNIVADNDANNTFSATGLSPLTTYFFFIFSFNDSGCTGGPLYNTTGPLTGNETTTAATYCIPSTTNPNFYIDDFSTTGGATNITNNNSGYSTNGYGDFTGLAVTQTAGGTVNFTSNFVGNGSGTFGANIWIDYNNDSDFTDPGEQVFASGAYVTGITGSFVVPGITSAGSYRMRILIDFFDTNPDSCFISANRGEAEDYTLIVTVAGPCTTPTAQPTALVFTSVTSATISASFTAASPAPDNYLVVINTTGATPIPIDGTIYNIGDTIGGGNTVVDNDNNLVFSASGLTPLTTYYFFIFSFNNFSCSGGPLYNTTGPLTGNTTTTVTSPYCDAESTFDETDLYIDDVEFIGTLNDVSNLNSGFSSVFPIGYQDFTGLTNSIQAQGQGINVFFESGSYRGHLKAWVDWDLDGAFDDDPTTELVFDSAGVGTSSTTFGFIVPATQPIGDYRLRIRFYNSFFGVFEFFSYDFDSCEEFDVNGLYDEYGETEDYTFTVIQSCSATIDSITEANNCGDGTVLLSATGSVGTVEYNWYANEADTTPIETTLTGNWITPPLTSTTVYYVTAGNGSCESLVKTKITATINPVSTITFTPTIPVICGGNDIIQITASSTDETAYLIEEDFETGGLGVFTNNNILSYGAAEDSATMWQSQTSTFVPSLEVWFPAISSGFGTNQFVMATSDYGSANITENALESSILDSSTFTDLTLSFDIYFSRYLFIPTIPEDVNVEVSTDGGTNWTIVQTYDDDIGYGTDFQNVTFDLSAYVNETNLRVRIRYYANVWCDGVAIDNVELFGTRPTQSIFTWTSALPIDAYTDAAASIPYVGTAISTVYVRPTIAQLQVNSFSFVATATLSNGCSISENISVNNSTKYWLGSSSTNWNDGANWRPLGVPTSSNCVIIPDQAIISGTGYDAYARNLTVESTGNLELQSDNNLTVTDWIEVESNGVFDVRDSANLVQVTDVTTNNNIGNINMERSVTVTNTDYVFWSSPVENYAVTAISPGTSTAYIWHWIPSIGGLYGTWQNTTENMTPAKGYIVLDLTGTATAGAALFSGRPNNGVINRSLTRGTYTGVDYPGAGSTMATANDDNLNLVGNPYPSAILADDIINQSVITGTLYFWRHLNPADNAVNDPFYADYVYNYNPNDYLLYNSMGSNPTGFNGRIASGQSFFVYMNDASPSGTNLTFNNTMRSNLYDNSQFYRQNTIERHRIWLDLVDSSNSSVSILVGYAQGATNGKDLKFDGDIYAGAGNKFYSLIGNDEMSIQGKSLPFVDTDIIPLGVEISQDGNYTIAINSLDGLFLNNSQSIYLEDSYTNNIHDLRASPYTFYATIGTYNDRFILRYNNNTLGLDELTEQSSLSITAPNFEYIKVKTDIGLIKSIQVFDLLGRILIDKKDINQNEYIIDKVGQSEGVYLVKAILTNDVQKTKKIVLKQ